MTEQSSGNFCEIIGCTTPATSSRWVTVGGGEQRQVEVCWKHEEEDIAEGDLEPVPTA